MTGGTKDDMQVVSVQRRFDGTRIVRFPNARPTRDLPSQEVLELLDGACSEIECLHAAKSEEQLKSDMLAAIRDALTDVKAGSSQVTADALRQVEAELSAANMESAVKRSTHTPRYSQLKDAVAELLAHVSRPHPPCFGWVGNDCVQTDNAGSAAHPGRYVACFPLLTSQHC